MSDALLIAIISAASGTSFGAVILALFARRKTRAEADVTVGEAWKAYFAEKAADITRLQQSNDQLRGELKAAQADITRLQRHENDSLFWQAQVVERDKVVGALLANAGIRGVPPMPQPPAARPRYTRAEDREEQR